MPAALMPNAGIPVGLRKRATDALASAADMKSEDWVDLVGGMLKFFGEEAQEPEHQEGEDGPFKLRDLVDQVREESRQRGTGVVTHKPRIEENFTASNTAKMQREHAEFMKRAEAEAQRIWAERFRRGDEAPAEDDTFNESDHPRASNGQFGSGGNSEKEEKGGYLPEGRKKGSEKGPVQPIHPKREGGYLPKGKKESEKGRVQEIFHGGFLPKGKKEAPKGRVQQIGEDGGEVVVDDQHDGPWVSCMSKDGGTMYRNTNLPKSIEIKGKIVDLDDELKSHEVPEFERLQRIMAVFVESHGREPNDQERKVIYQEAHEGAGIPGERTYCKANDIDYNALQAWFRGEETKLEKGPFKNPPPDADVKPIPHGHGELETTLDQIGGEALRALESGIPQKGTGVNTDAALRLALDRASVRSFDQDGRMRVSVANISKANICPYRGDEIPGWEALGLEPDKIYRLLRDPAELKKSVPTWNGIQILKEHKPVDIDDHQKHDIVGTTGTNAEFADPYLRNSLVFWTKEGIDLIETDEQRELSCGYHYVPVMTAGVFNDEPYDGVMTEIRGNHVAIVGEGRAGPDVVIGDTIEQMQWAAIEDALTTAWAA